MKQKTEIRTIQGTSWVVPRPGSRYESTPSPSVSSNLQVWLGFLSHPLKNNHKRRFIRDPRLTVHLRRLSVGVTHTEPSPSPPLDTNKSENVLWEVRVVGTSVHFSYRNFTWLCSSQYRSSRPGLYRPVSEFCLEYPHRHVRFTCPLSTSTSTHRPLNKQW